MMKSSYPDPSITSQIDFYPAAFHIKKLLRRRGWQNVEPMNGEVWGFMPPNLYKDWLSFNKRQKLVRKRDGGKEFERFVAQIISQYYCNPATFSNKVLDLSPGGDFDVLVEGPGETLFHFETKTSVSKTSKSTDLPEIWNFMVREAKLGADLSVFLYDTNYSLEKELLMKFEVLYALAKFITDNKGNMTPADQINTQGWIDSLDLNNVMRLRTEITKYVYYVYWPVVVISGGDDLKKNIGDAIALYFTGVRHLSPYTPFRKPNTNEVFQKLPHWQDLPKEVQGEKIRKKINVLIKKE